jgi:hypothetical protein
VEEGEVVALVVNRDADAEGGCHRLIELKLPGTEFRTGF